VVETNQQSLKYLLRQKIGTPCQKKWLTKVLGYSFKVEYKKEVENKVADALSMRKGWEEEVSLSLLSIYTSTWVSKVKEHYKEEDEMLALIDSWNSNNLDSTKYAVRNGLLFYKGRLCLGESQ
jgi:KaiC/GvpD/RAD55 family RecA-like ATPase